MLNNHLATTPYQRVAGITFYYHELLFYFNMVKYRILFIMFTTAHKELVAMVQNVLTKFRRSPHTQNRCHYVGYKEQPLSKYFVCILLLLASGRLVYIDTERQCTGKKRFGFALPQCERPSSWTYNKELNVASEFQQL